MKFTHMTLFFALLLAWSSDAYAQAIEVETTTIEEEIDDRHAPRNERGQMQCDFCAWKDWFRSNPKPQPKPQPMYVRPAFKQYVNDESRIGLQNLENRAVVYCYDNDENSAESCAEYFEQNGYIRFRDIPYKTANYDFLKVDTYPTRRWRDNEITSRW